MAAPVVVFVYNRPEHARRTLEALNNNYMVENTDLFIFSDGPKHNKDIKDVEAVNNYIRQFYDISLFKKIIIENDKTAFISISEGRSAINGQLHPIDKRK